MPQEVIVSIQCLVYNHEPYLRQCLDGFVMQKTNFKFEAIMHDDASTDRSADIIREYAEKYPDIIKPIFEKENQYSKGFDALARIMDAACKGKYIAVCEGDDHWIDPLKLQRQVDFLEAHPDYSMCFTRAVCRVEAEGRDYPFGTAADRKYSGTELFQNWIVPTASIVYRKSVLSSDLYRSAFRSKNFLYGDAPLILSCAGCGDVFGFSDTTCVYRKHAGGVSSRITNSAEGVFQLRKHFLEFPVVFGPAYRRKAAESAVSACMKSISIDLKNGKFPWRKIRTMLRISFPETCLAVMRNLRKKRSSSTVSRRRRLRNI